MNISNPRCSWWAVAGFCAWVLCLAIVADVALPALARIAGAAVWVVLSVVGCAVAGRCDS